MNGLRDVDTGLVAYSALLRRLRELTRAKAAFAVILMDLDFFNNIERHIGRTEGDRVLERIGAWLGGDATVYTARKESDEFLLLAEGAGLEVAADTARRLRRQICRRSWIELDAYKKLPIRASFGVAAADGATATAFTLLKAADTALLCAKKKGRNRVETAPPGAPYIRRTGVCRTIVGHGLRGRCKEGAVAYTAAIAEPYGLELDGRGGLLFVDRSNHQIKRIAGGRISTVAGDGESGYTGDGGDAARARLCKPSGVALHAPSGRLYIADTGNHCIRVVEQGCIATVAGDGEPGYRGDGGDGRRARLNRPGGVAVDDAGYVYTNDYGNNVIRRLSPEGHITTVVGNGHFGGEGDGGSAREAALNKPYGLCVTADGMWLFIADYGNHRIRRVDMRTGRIDTVCGTGSPGYSGDGGPAREARLNGPYWVTPYGRGGLLIADAGNHCIRLLDLGSGTIRTLVGDGQPGYIDAARRLGGARLNIPAGMAADSTWIYVADYGNNAIRAVRGETECFGG